MILIIFYRIQPRIDSNTRDIRKASAWWRIFQPSNSNSSGTSSHINLLDDRTTHTRDFPITVNECATREKCWKFFRVGIAQHARRAAHIFSHRTYVFCFEGQKSLKKWLCNILCWCYVACYMSATLIETLRWCCMEKWIRFDDFWSEKCDRKMKKF
jgi:hypothetical protein